MKRREPVLTLAQLVEFFGADRVWQEDVGEPAEGHAEPRTDAVWRWVCTGIVWRSCGCAHAGLEHGRDRHE